jgi:hypothetical protein
MNLQAAVNLINSFSPRELPLRVGVDGAVSRALEKHKSVSLPPELKAYIDTLCPQQRFTFEGVGSPINILTTADLSWSMPGYNIDPETLAPIAGWKDSWFLIANEGGEPIIVDISETNSTSTVYSAIQGGEGWEFSPIADSIGLFLFCAAAIEHAMDFPGVDEALDDDFNLADKAAQWLFPLIKQHAPTYYEEWVAVFENYEDGM